MGGEGCWSSFKMWVGRRETGFHLHHSSLIVSETDCLAFTVADPFLQAETLNIPYTQPVQKKNRAEVDGVSGVDSLLIHKGPEWPFNTQSESLFTGCV